MTEAIASDDDVREPGLIAGETESEAKPETNITAPRQIVTSGEVKARSPEDIYGERLREMWAMTHPDAAGQEIEVQWESARASVLSVIDPTSLVSRPTSDSVTAIAGSIGEVELLVGNDVDRLPLGGIEGYVRERLAPTFERLERLGEGTRERRVDIVARALRDVGGSPGVARFVRGALAGYLEGQPEELRGSGFYATAGTLGILLGATQNPEMRPAALVLYDYVLSGLAARSIGDVEPQRMTLDTVSVAASNSAAVLAMMNRDAGDAHQERIRPQLTTLISLSAATAVARSVDEGIASRALAELGLDPGGAVSDLLTSLRQMSVVAGAWGGPSVDLAHLEAAAGIATMLEGNPGRTATNLFNAGLSLDKAERANEPPYLEAQMLLNALGLRVAFVAAQTMDDALSRFEGLDCSVNFMSTVVTYKNAVAGAKWSNIADRGLGRLVRILAFLPDWDPLRGSNDNHTQLSLARLAAGARRLGVSAEPDISFDAFKSAIEGAIVALLPAAEFQGDEAVSTARLVRMVFEDVLEEKSWGLESEVRRVADLRASPTMALTNLYQQSMKGDPPAVVSGVMTPDEWVTVRLQLLRKVDTIATLLRSFTVD